MIIRSASPPSRGFDCISGMEGMGHSGAIALALSESLACRQKPDALLRNDGFARLADGECRQREKKVDGEQCGDARRCETGLAPAKRISSKVLSAWTANPNEAPVQPCLTLSRCSSPRAKLWGRGTQGGHRALAHRAELSSCENVPFR